MNVWLFQAPQYGDVSLTVEHIPSVVLLEEQFQVGLRITNIWWDIAIFCLISDTVFL